MQLARSFFPCHSTGGLRAAAHERPRRRDRHSQLRRGPCPL